MSVENESRRNPHFTLSIHSSPSTSRSSSPGLAHTTNGNGKHVLEEKDRSVVNFPGGLPMDVYEATLPWWRTAVRKKLVDSVKWESNVIALIQKKIRAPWLDAYFVYTSSLGTHTFFMTALPALFFFGFDELGRGLLFVLAAGVYCSSVLKDLFCSPRPYSPPVTRLTMGSHHLEYGFPSTHSTNSISIALYLFSHIYDLTYSSSPTLSINTFTFLSILLGIYTISIVFGRLYTAMHSFTDCFVGVLLGTVIWWSYTSWTGIPITFNNNNLPFLSSDNTYTLNLGRGLGLDKLLWGWTTSKSWKVPFTFIPICLLLVNQHPQPVDDCPCFEDAIACASVILGSLVGRWITLCWFDDVVKSVVVMPGSGWVLNGVGLWIRVERDWSDVLVWWSVAMIKMTVGILVIFTWRLLAKSALHLILPPTFRMLARVFQLPNRRFYTPATEYKSVPSEFAVGPQGLVGVLHPIPSVIDLPSQVKVPDGDGVIVGKSGTLKIPGGEREVKMRNVNGVNGNGGSNGGGEKVNGGRRGGGGGVEGKIQEDEEAKNGETVKHYDADVLTKVIVYAGIAFLAVEAIPLAFDSVGLGVKSWVD